MYAPTSRLKYSASPLLPEQLLDHICRLQYPLLFEVVALQEDVTVVGGRRDNNLHNVHRNLDSRIAWGLGMPHAPRGRAYEFATQGSLP